MRRLVRLALALSLTLAVAPAPAQQTTPRRAATLTIEILDVGQGDSILIRSPEGKTALIDAGPSYHVVELLKSRGIKSLDLVVVSHHHADHYGGMVAVVREFKPRVFLASGSSHTTPRYLAVPSPPTVRTALIPLPTTSRNQPPHMGSSNTTGATLPPTG